MPIIYYFQSAQTLHSKHSSKIQYISIFDESFNLCISNQEWWCRPIILHKIQLKWRGKKNFRVLHISRHYSTQPLSFPTMLYYLTMVLLHFLHFILHETSDSFLSKYYLVHLTRWTPVLSSSTHKWHIIDTNIPYINVQKCYYETHHFVDFLISKDEQTLRHTWRMTFVYKPSMALEN